MNNLDENENHHDDSVDTYADGHDIEWQRAVQQTEGEI